MSEIKSESTPAPEEPETKEAESGGEDAAPSATESEKSIAASLLGTIAGRSEEAMRRAYSDLSDNPRMQDAKDRLGKASHSFLAQLNIASEEEIVALRDEIARLEQRLAVLEKAVATRSRGTSKAASAEG